MGESTGITWTDSTINCWVGCAKVSTGCSHCYAEQSRPVRVKRAAGLEVWGANAARSETKGWEASLRKWQKQAAALASQVSRFAIHRHLVFGQSLSDTFEDYDGSGGVRFANGDIGTGLAPLRARFFAAIEAAPALTFQLLTKRPENILRMVPPSWLDHWPEHVWIGATVEDQANADERIPHLLRVPAAVRFLSVEPQVDDMEIKYSFGQYIDKWGNWRAGTGISWVIQGGESGSKARPFDLAWARILRDQCRAAGVPYFLKQLGAHPVTTWADLTGPGWPRETKFWQSMPGATTHRVILPDSHGANESEWPADLRNCRAFPEVQRG